MPRNHYETMNPLIASTKCALVEKLNGGNDRIVSTLDAIYSIEISHPRYSIERKSGRMVCIMWKKGYVPI